MRKEREREIRIEADTFRSKCKINGYAISDLFKECEQLRYKLIRYPLGEGEVLGFASKREKDNIIFTNTCSRLSRELFTLAHEIGHMVLHMERELPFFDTTETIFQGNQSEAEQEANYFAVCLLMPADEVEKFLDLEIDDFQNQGLNVMDIARMMSAFQVSFEMTLNRLENLGKITHAERVRLDNEKNRLRVSRLLRSTGGSGRLNQAGKEIRIPYEYLDYVIYNYNHRAIPLGTLEKALACYELTLDDIRDRLTVSEEEEKDLDELIGGLAD